MLGLGESAFPGEPLPASAVSMSLRRDVTRRGDELGTDEGMLLVNFSSYNKTQAFLDKYDNQTSSLSTNTGGLCQFYK